LCVPNLYLYAFETYALSGLYIHPLGAFTPHI